MDLKTLYFNLAYVFLFSAKYRLYTENRNVVVVVVVVMVKNRNVVVEGKLWKCGGGGIWFHYSRNCVEKKSWVDVGSICGVDVRSM